MDIPKPEGWKNQIEVFGRVLTFDQSFSNEGAGLGFAWWHDEPDEVELRYHYLDIAPDIQGERVEIQDFRDGANQTWTFVRAADGWALNPSGIPPEILGDAPAWDAGPEKFPIVRLEINEAFLSDMREAIKSLMEADPFYFDIPIITERLQNIEGRIAETVGRASGLAILLVTPIVSKALVNVTGANFDDIQFVARIFENTKSNATGKEALDVAIYTAAFWSQLKPDTLSASLRLDDPPIALGNDPRYLTYDVSGVTSGGTKISIPRLADLTIDASDLAAIALAHPTPGAVVFYTLDGSAPAPRNAAAVAYLAPFNAASGSTLRARAWLPGYIPSAEKKESL